ncbi:MAG: nucleotidyltransferase family protein [Alphaproteobacteria bacterium]|nr:nucleotidyltransferase family protein [Alphaproteobacteria bacterium]
MKPLGNAPAIRSGMVLAAGEGRRMRPVTETLPKPLIPILGRPLLDHALDKLEAAGVDTLVVNAFYLADRIVDHCATRPGKPITLSRETEKLETGGGVAQALPLLGDSPFFALNGDNLIIDGPRPALDRMAEAFDPTRMDALLMLHPLAWAHGYAGQGDFHMDQDGRLTRRSGAEVTSFVFTGVQILTPGLFTDLPDAPWSLNRIYDRAIERERLFGIAHDGEWFHVSRPDDIAATEERVSSTFVNFFC